MKPIAFPSSFITGHAAIDDDHRRLIALINRINECFTAKMGAEAHELCTALQLLIGQHHEREEQILHDANFPRFESHIESHLKFLQQCRHISTDCNQACLRNQAENCTTELTTGIVEHIVSQDLDFKSYLQAEGIAEDAEKPPFNPVPRPS